MWCLLSKENLGPPSLFLLLLTLLLKYYKPLKKYKTQCRKTKKIQRHFLSVNKRNIHIVVVTLEILEDETQLLQETLTSLVWEIQYPCHWLFLPHKDNIPVFVWHLSGPACNYTIVFGLSVTSDIRSIQILLQI